MVGRRAARRDGTTDDDQPDDDADIVDLDHEDRSPPSERRRWSIWARPPAPTADEAPPDDLSLKPTAMRSPEPLYGYVVGLELIGVSVLNLTVTHGKGAPTHPSTVLALIGLFASIALLGIVRTHHRLIVAFSSVIVAFFVTLPKVPDSLTITHLLALVIPVIYAFVLSQRQRKAATALNRAARSAPAGVSLLAAAPSRWGEPPWAPSRETGTDRARGQPALHAAQSETGPPLTGRAADPSRP